MTKLSEKKCVSCEGGVSKLTTEQITPLLTELHPAWKVVQEHHLEREYSFSDFASALVFVNKVAEVAEAEFHHPDITLSWGKVHLSLLTHDIGGLSENDFILAAKLDTLE